MRLTLRSMLAYLDNILDPEDAQDIGRRIQESEQATKLMHRTRDVMRRLRLAAPSLTDRGPGLDPNTVAEYLDHALSDDRVRDFEKVCLESDVHLAEVACCHQILTVVQVEPALVDPASRQRMYQVPQVQAAAAVPTQPAQAESAAGRPVGDGAKARPRAKPTVPDYLRDPRKRYRWALPAAAALLLVGCFTLLVAVALGMLEGGTPLGNLLGIRPAETKLANGPASAVSAPKQHAGPKQSPPSAADKATATSQSPAPTTSPRAVTEPEKPTNPVPPEPGAAAGGQPPGADVGMIPEPPGSAKPGPAKVGPAAGPPGAAAAAADSRQAEETPADIIPKPPREPGDASPAEPSAKPPAEPGAKAPGAVGPEAATGAGVATAAEPPAVPPQEPPEPPQPMGRLMSGRQVLLRYDASGPNWQRVRPNGIVAHQDRLVALPTYRAELTLSAGVTLHVLGGTELELLPSTQEQPAGLKIAFGRVVLMPLANAGTQLRVVFGDCKGILTFVRAESAAALEVAPLRVPGADPQAEPVRLVANLYATTGEIVWDEENKGQAVELTAPARLPIGGPSAQAPIAGGEFPKWIVAEPIGLLDAQASAAVETALQADRPADLVLMELDDHRKKEVRSLAARCEVYLGWFGSMVAVLNQADAKADWPEHIDKLRNALARGPETAEAIRKALEKQYPRQDADELYRMLWGYSDKDLQEGADAKLVKLLDHETLAVRLLAFWNLREITGGLGLYYSPELTPAKRQQPIRRWKERLAEKAIRLKPTDAGGKKAASGGALPPGSPERGL